MNILGLASPGRGEFWVWTGTDRFGETRNYCTHSPEMPESAMLAHLSGAYHGLSITALRRATSKDYIAPKPGVEIKSHAFMNGVRDGFRNYVATLGGNEQRSLIEEAMNLKPMTLPGWGRIPDPLTNAVADALYWIDHEKQAARDAKPKSIRERFPSIRKRFTL